MSLFKKAQRSLVYLKLALTGPTGSGKTYGALLLASGLVARTGKRIAFIDTENDSASLYSGDGSMAGKIQTFDFDTVNITPPHDSEDFLRAIDAAVQEGYGVAIIDSASHFWKGILQYKDQIDSRGKGNSYTNWKEADRKFDPVIDAVLHSKIHLIFCMRSKMDYVQEEVNGKKIVRKVGMAPVMRDGIEYEFTTVLDLAADNSAASSKDRTGMFPPDRIFRISKETGIAFADWLETATPALANDPAPAAPPQPAPEKTEEERKRAAFERFGKLLEKHKLISDDRAMIFWDTAADLIGAPNSASDWTINQLTEAWNRRKEVLDLVENHLNSIPL